MNSISGFSNSTTPTTVATTPECDDYLLCHSQQPCFCNNVAPSVPTPPQLVDDMWPYHTMSPLGIQTHMMNACPPAPPAPPAVVTIPCGTSSSSNSVVDCECCRASQPGDFKPSFYNPFEVKHRRRTSRAQFKVLEKTFHETPKPNAQKRRALAQKLGMTPRGVQVWFQNRRAKAKAQQRREQQQKEHEQQQHMSPNHPQHEPITPPFPMDPFWPTTAAVAACNDDLQSCSYNGWIPEQDVLTTAAAFDTLFPLSPSTTSSSWIPNATDDIYYLNDELLRRSSCPILPQASNEVRVMIASLNDPEN